MIGFVLAAAAMLIAAVAVIAVPLLRPLRGSRNHPSPAVALLSDQLAELKADLERGVLGASHYQAARDDLERRVLEEAAEEAPHLPAAVPAAPAMAVVLGLLITAGGISFYGVVGEPGALRDAVVDGARDEQPNAEQIEAMVRSLARRLERDSGDLEGWTMLARSYYVLRQYDDAAAAYERARELAPRDASLLAGHADALAMLRGGSMSGKPLELVEQALAIDPDNAKALALAGRHAFDSKDYNAAAAYWERLKAAVPEDSAAVPAIEAGIAEARARSGPSAPDKAAP